MPALLRTFIQLLICLPGVILWFIGGLVAMAYCPFIAMGKLTPNEALAMPAALAVALTGHLMQTLGGNLLGDPQHRLAANRIGERLAWDAALDILGIGVAGTGISLAPCLVNGQWLRAVATLVLLAGLVYGLKWVNRRRAAFLDRWERENELPDGAEAIPGVARLQEPSPADR